MNDIYTFIKENYYIKDEDKIKKCATAYDVLKSHKEEIIEELNTIFFKDMFYYNFYFATVYKILFYPNDKELIRYKLECEEANEREYLQRKEPYYSSKLGRFADLVEDGIISRAMSSVDMLYSYTGKLNEVTNGYEYGIFATSFSRVIDLECNKIIHRIIESYTHDIIVDAQTNIKDCGIYSILNNLFRREFLSKSDLKCLGSLTGFIEIMGWDKVTVEDALVVGSIYYDDYYTIYKKNKRFDFSKFMTMFNDKGRLL